MHTHPLVASFPQLQLDTNHSTVAAIASVSAAAHGTVSIRSVISNYASTLFTSKSRLKTFVFATILALA